jgi:hypothetical protein
MRIVRFALALATTGVLVLSGASSGGAQSPATTDQQIPGALIGVGPTQRTLIVEYTNEELLQGCGVLGMTPSVTETADTVSVTLTAHVGVLAPGTFCGDSGHVWTATVPLSAPLGGRSVLGLGLQGAAFYSGAPPPTMPNLVGLSPRDARLLLSLPRGIPAGQPFGVGPVALVDHHTRHSTTGAPALVVRQRPIAGTPIRRHMLVVLSVAP